MDENEHGALVKLRLRKSQSRSHAHGHLTKELYARIYSEKAGDQRGYPDLTLAFLLLPRTPQCGHTVWETKLKDIFEN